MAAPASTPSPAAARAGHMTRDGHDIVLRCTAVGHSFGPKHVLHDVNIDIVRGQIVALVGPSGSGKSTLLRAILGTHPPARGSVLMDGQPVLAAGRARGIVYQKYTLFPFLTALHNVALGPTLEQSQLWQRVLFTPGFRRLRREYLEQAEVLLKKVGLGNALDLYPAEMSGGMCQRVAIAQALIMKPDVLLLDEPFGALDEAMREELQGMMLEFYQDNIRAKRAGETPPYTMLIVTHELNEAVYVSDRVLGLSQYWRYEDEGFERPPGATIVYDSVAPVFAPGDNVDYNILRAQRAEIRAAVMEPEPRRIRNEQVRFWSQVAQGKGGGVLTR